MIPRILHQTWRSAVLPVAAQRWTSSWRSRNPDFDYRFYDDDACSAFVASHAPQYLDVYRGLPRPIQCADFFRYLVVYHYGGVYADIDMECLRPFDPFLGIADLVLGVETRLTRTRQRELGYREPWQLANCVFAAAPGHWFLAMLIEWIARAQSSVDAITNPTDGQVEDSTGPRMLTRLYYDLTPNAQGDIGILAPIYWMPPTAYPNRWPLNVNMFARHHFWGSWKDRDAPPAPLRRRIIERNRLPYPWTRAMAARVGGREPDGRGARRSGTR